MSSSRAPSRRLRVSWRRAAVAIALVAAGLVSGTASAIPAPTVAISDLRAYRNIVQDGDLLFVVRYELPVQSTTFPTPVTTPEAWCQYLRVQTGCTGASAQPSDASSLQVNYALASLYSACNTDCSSGTLEDQEQPPRVSHGLSGFYIDPGHSLTWGSTALRGCLEANSGVFSPVSRACTAATWNNAAATTAAQRTQLGTDLRSMLRTLEPLRAVPRTSYVANNLITTAGRTLANEALSGVERILPSYFQAAASSANTTGFQTPSAALALQTRIDATAVASGMSSTMASTGNALLGLSGGAFATFLFFAFGGVVAVLLLRYTGQPVLAVVGFGTVALVGVFARGPSVSAVLVAIVILGLPGIWYAVKKMAQ